MAQTERNPDEQWETRDSIPPPPEHHHDPHQSGEGTASGDTARYVDPLCDGTTTTPMEPAGRAAYALMQRKCEALLAVMLRRTFSPIQDTTMVPIYPCPHCGDGGLRTAGTVQLRKGTAFVRACDTCCALEIGEQPIRKL